MTVMRIIDGKTLKEVPMGMLLPHERQAIQNHGQSLHRLNDRGGIATYEALAIIEGRGWGQVRHHADDEERLTKLVEVFNGA